jgi:FkbM family methyltransferase
MTAEELRRAWNESGGPSRFASFNDLAQWLRLRLPAFSPGTPQASGNVRVRFREAKTPMLLRPGTRDADVAAQIFLLGEYELVRRIPMPDEGVVVDLGANIGGFVLFAETLWQRPRYLAVEPDGENVAVLRENVRDLAEDGRVEIVEACVGGEDGFTALDRSRGSWAVRMTTLSGTGDVPVVTVDRLLERFRVRRIDLLKCDIEGAERDVFARCSSWIGMVRHLVIEIHDPYRLADLEGHLRAAGSMLRLAATAPRPPGADNSTHLFSS